MRLPENTAPTDSKNDPQTKVSPGHAKESTNPAQAEGSIGERVVVHESEWNQKVSEAAYRRAEMRGFAPGRELDDWLEAEREFTRDLLSR